MTEQKPDYPYDEVRETLGFILDCIKENEYGMRVIVPAGGVYHSVKQLIGKIEKAEIPC